MSYRLQNDAVFLHIPKTGGTFVRQVLDENNLLKHYIGHEHSTFDLVQHYEWSTLTKPMLPTLFKRRLKHYLRPHQEKPTFKFCFVRHPLSWYESIWKYLDERNWNRWGSVNSYVRWHPASLVNEFRDPDFNGFLQKVLEKRPGFVTELFYSYVKYPVNYVGKTENLAQDLATVFDYLELNYDAEALLGKKKANISKRKDKLDWDPALKKRIIQTELPSLLYFDYLSAEEKESFDISGPIGVHPALQQIIPLSTQKWR